MHVKERIPKGLALSPATMPEETTTSNLVRRIAYFGRDRGVLVVLHSRALEGGYKNKNGIVLRTPSGADLELAVEVAPGQWLDLLLQAKTLKAVPGGHQYSEWKATQNAALSAWALSHGGRTPGMLLYNDSVPPFSDPPSFSCRAFGGCSGANRAQNHSHSEMTDHGWDLHDGTPAGVSLCLEKRLLAVDHPNPATIYNSHFPLEHLAHPLELIRQANRRTGANNGNPTQPVSATLLGDVPLTDQRPEWASLLMNSDLLDESPELDESAAAPDDEFHVAASAVIPFQAIA